MIIMHTAVVYILLSEREYGVTPYGLSVCVYNNFQFSRILLCWMNLVQNILHILAIQNLVSGLQFPCIFFRVKIKMSSTDWVPPVKIEDLYAKTGF